jgi:hypothetical protein
MSERSESVAHLKVSGNHLFGLQKPWVSGAAPGMRAQRPEFSMGAQGLQTQFMVQEKRLHVCLAFCCYRIEHLVLGIEEDQGMPRY